MKDYSIQALFSILALVGLFVCQPLYAYDYCKTNQQQSNARLSLSRTENSQLKTAIPAQVAVTTEQLSSTLYLLNGPDSWLSIGFDYQYNIFDFNGITPMTNGHLHAWNFPVGWYHDSSRSSLFFELTPALSVSSNVLRSPGLINQDALQLKSAFIYSRQNSITSQWVTGFRSDHSFGQYLLYPIAGLCWRPAKDWQLQLALPDFSINKNLSNKFRLSLFASPFGNQWRVFSKDKTRQSDFIYNAISIGITAIWKPVHYMEISARFARETKRDLTITLDNDQLLKTDIDANTNVALSAQVEF